MQKAKTFLTQCELGDVKQEILIALTEIYAKVAPFHRSHLERLATAFRRLASDEKSRRALQTFVMLTGRIGPEDLQRILDGWNGTETGSEDDD